MPYLIISGWLSPYFSSTARLAASSRPAVRPVPPGTEFIKKKVIVITMKVITKNF
nr:hypothetical protein [Mycoplasmopsis bovis]